MNKKKSFVLYFDMLPIIDMLPPEQRGWLFSALFAYAMQAAEQPERSCEEVLDKFSELEERTKLIFQFICGTSPVIRKSGDSSERPGYGAGRRKSGRKLTEVPGITSES